VAEESSFGQVQALFDISFLGIMRVSDAVLPFLRC
jgi:hypothetical protein